jgi:hypothetical protein
MFTARVPELKGWVVTGEGWTPKGPGAIHPAAKITDIIITADIAGLTREFINGISSHHNTDRLLAGCVHGVDTITSDLRTDKHIVR